MIVDTIGNRKLYDTISPRLKSALEYCASTEAAEFAEKVIEVDGRDIYALFQGYVTEVGAGREYETHRRYIDVQYILEGEEIIRVTNVNNLKPFKPYDTEKDIQFYSTVPGTDVRLSTGDFAVLFPHDAHLPKLMMDKPVKVKKIVVKVLL